MEEAELAGYRVEAVAGRGGMGVVYRAFQPGLERTVALKVIAPDRARDREFRERFVRESRLAASLDHPNVVPVYEAGERDDQLFIAMRWVEGTDLRRLLRESGALPPRLAATIVAQVAGALDAAHARGLIHRDVKPANVLIDESHGQPHAYLSDFGLAKSEASSGGLTATGAWIGTPDYAAPEQIEDGVSDARSDVYALGCVLFATLTGRPPFDSREALATAWAQVHQEPPTLASVRPEAPAALEPVMRRALAKRPGDRYQTAGDLGRAVAAAASGGQAPPLEPAGPDRNGHTLPTAPLARTAPTIRRRPRRWPAALAGASAAILVAAAAIGVLAALGKLPGSSRSGALVPTTVIRPIHRPPAPPPAPDASGDTVRCEASPCTQGGARVAHPPGGQSCERGGNTGTWTRLDAAGPPLYACLLESEPLVGLPRPHDTVPDLAGAQLDLAEQFLDGDGISHDTSGGGALGIIDSSNWTVCSTDPPSGAPLPEGGNVTLSVDRSC
jgi:serine/threonine protein kinase